MNKKILLIYSHNPLGLLAIQQDVENIKLLSKHNIIPLNIYPSNKIPAKINLYDFDGVVIDSSSAYFPKLLDELDENISIKLQDYDGAKVLFKKDEHINCHKTARIIGQKKIDIVYTCLEESQISQAYPQHLVGEAQFIQHLYGYVSDHLIDLANSHEYSRCIDISYRGLIKPLQFGRLGYEKWSIGQAVYKALKDSQLKIDISTRQHDRLNGNDWLKFLSASKSVLGVEAGSNLFDFDGEVERECLLYEINNINLKQDPEAFYKKAHEMILNKYEDNVQYALISPRHFEAAASRTLQILYEGKYSNIFKPYQHYIPLKRDLSNLEEVSEFLLNSSKRNQITDCAYDEIVKNNEYHYNKKVEKLDHILESICKQKNINRSSNKIPDKKKGNVIILVNHEAHLDPRITWLKEGFHNFAKVNIVGVTRCPEKHIKWKIKASEVIEVNLNYSKLSKAHDEYEKDTYSDYCNLKRIITSFSNADTFNLPTSSFCSSESVDRFVNLCNYFDAIDRSLRFAVNQIMDSNGTVPDLLVCCDLASLLPGIILAQKHKIPLVYDAHEFWAYSNQAWLPWETDFWLYYEQTLLQYVNFPITVSKTLAEKMAKAYHTDFSYIPNAGPTERDFNVKREKFKVDLLYDDCDELPNFEDSTVVKFLYMGIYAPGRGLEQLIDNWRSVPEHNKLILRGNRWSYTDTLIERAKKYGLYNKTIFFFKPVKEIELVSMAGTFDVGLIPYEPDACLNHKYCCPNKLAQYMAAGIPILSNNLVEVERVIRDANCGFAIDFNLEQKFSNVINMLNDADLRKKLGTAAREYFLEKYNWNILSKPLNDKLKKIIQQTNCVNSISINIHNLPEAEDAEEAQKIIAHDQATQAAQEAAQAALTALSAQTSMFRKLYIIFRHLITRRVRVFNPILRIIKAMLLKHYNQIQS